MPYGLPKNIKSPENEAWMERCVTRVMKTGKDKGSAIAICKSSLIKRKGNKSEASVEVTYLLTKDLNSDIIETE